MLFDSFHDSQPSLPVQKQWDERFELTGSLHLRFLVFVACCLFFLQAWYRGQTDNAVNSTVLSRHVGAQSASVMASGPLLSRVHASTIADSTAVKDTVDFEFSQSTTRLCGQASRRQNVNATTDEHYAFCSVSFTSTSKKWVHGAMTFDAPTATMKFYLNGAPIDTEGAITATVWPDAITGDNPSKASTYMLYTDFSTDADADDAYQASGTVVDNLRLWNRVRTPAEIAASYNKPLAGTESGLLAYYLFHRVPNTGTNYDIVQSVPARGANISDPEVRVSLSPIGFSIFGGQPSYVTGEGKNGPYACRYAGCQ
jgi:hypothetical protein